MREYRLYIGLILVTCVIVGGSFIYDRSVEKESENIAVRSNEEIKANYKKEQIDILVQYSQESAVINIEDLEPITAKVVADLLELRVPSEEKDTHLALILTLNDLEQGLAENDSIRVDKAISKYNSLFPLYRLQLDWPI